MAWVWPTGVGKGTTVQKMLRLTQFEALSTLGFANYLHYCVIYQGNIICTAIILIMSKLPSSYTKWHVLNKKWHDLNTKWHLPTPNDFTMIVKYILHSTGPPVLHAHLLSFHTPSPSHKHRSTWRWFLRSSEISKREGCHCDSKLGLCLLISTQWSR